MNLVETQNGQGQDTQSGCSDQAPGHIINQDAMIRPQDTESIRMQ